MIGLRAPLLADALPRASMAALLAVALILTASSVEAHAIGLSRGDYRVTAQGVDVDITLARGDAISAFPWLDFEGRHFIDPSSLASTRAEIERGTIQKIRVTTAEGPCTGTLIDAELTDQDGFDIRARYRCPEGGTPITVALPLLDDLSHGHRHAAHVAVGVIIAEHLLYGRQAHFVIDRAASTAFMIAHADSTASAAPSGAPGGAAHWVGFVRMGMEHILTGYDHLLFLFALVLAGGTVRSLALAITSFTVAHSVTLALAVLGFVTPPTRWIEPAIALSIAYVGVENFFVRPEVRYRVTFPFGLLHGFGFAGALSDISIPRAQVPWALLSFNLGVEMGQLAWMLALGIAVAQLRRCNWLTRRGVAALSAAVVVVGLAWFATRVGDAAIQARGLASAGVGGG
jgi:hydrogenase/urease accessory protein HupE